MRVRLLLAAVAAVGAIGLGGCGSTVCDRNDSFDPSTKVGDCSVQLPARLLGTKSACSNALSACSDSDKTALDELVGCWENLPACSQADQASWQGQSDACYQKAANVSEGCKTAFFGSNPLPGTDAGGDPDGGVDAGIQPDTTDAGALDLIAVADEDRIALAWTSSQPGPVSKWQVNGLNDLNIVTDPTFVTPPSMNYSAQVGTGMRMKYFVVGMTGQDEVVMGVPDAGVVDAGTGCTDNFQCAANKVCNIGTGACESLPCTDSDVCPSGYACDSVVDMVCERQTVAQDGGIDAGTEEKVVEQPRPFISELAEVTTGPSKFSSDRVISSFAAKNIDAVAIDSARQFAVMELEDQGIYGHATQNRGASFKVQPLDPSGSRPKAAWEPKSNTVFICYNALGAVRVRASTDSGKTFPGALDLRGPEPMEGEQAPAIQSCAIAPWQDGTAMVVAFEGDTVKAWVVTKDLQIQGEPATVFTSSEQWFAPERLAIATLPSDFIVHVLFTAKRTTTGGSPDTEILDMYRDGTTGGAFVGPKLVNAPNAFEQRDATVTIDPVSKRAVAAFVSRESATGGLLKDTIYVSFWVPTAKAWATGSDLNLFVQNNVSKQYWVIPDRPTGESWIARAPSLTASPTGKIYLSFMAGSDANGQPNLSPWMVEFGLEAPNKVIENGVKGWFVPPAKKVSESRVYSPSSSRDYGGPVIVADSQISYYTFFVEGVGAGGVTANRPLVVSLPK